MRLKRFLALLLSASLSLSPSAARGEILKQSEFPSHRWIDKTPRKFKECVVGWAKRGPTGAISLRSLAFLVYQ